MKNQSTKRPNILKLATKISLECLTYTGITYNDCEYKILEPIITDEMCEIAMHMKLNTFRTAEEIARRAKKPLDYTQKQLDALHVCGFARIHTENGVDTYFYPIWVPGIMEGVLTNDENTEKYPQMGEAFEEYTRKRLGALVPFLEDGTAFMRVMPVEEAIKNNSRTASYDELSTLIENAFAISVGDCSCRRSRRLMGEGCGHLEKDMCMYLNDSALSYARTGAHRLISKEEAYEILKRAEDNGLVHDINQTEGFDDTIAICNCCGCSCFALRIAGYFRTPGAISSNFRAEIDKEKCVACGQCVENCQVNALKLGRKLCAKDPIPAPKPDPTPRDTMWGSKMYDADYRENRTDSMDTGTAPCKANCPAHLPVQGYIKLAAQGKYTEALELIKKNNPFPAVCGRVCNRRCEDACTRGDIDDPIAIDDIKDFIAQKDLNKETRFIPTMLNQTGKPYTEKIAIVGSGPAGLTCAYYLKVKGYPVTVFEKEAVPGGMMSLAIPSFRLEKDLVNAEIDILREMGVEFRCGVEVGRDVTISQLRDEGYKGFYIAIGLQDGGKLNIPGENVRGVMSGIEFMKQVNLTNDVKLSGNVVVIGGGNIAADVARTAVRCGAEKVEMYCLETETQMPCGEEDRNECLKEKIEIHPSYGPVAIEEKNGACSAIKFKKCLSVLDEKGHFAPVFDQEDSITTNADYVIYCIGQKPALGQLLAGTKVEFNPNGTVKADPMTYQTAEADIFVGGDIYTGQKFCIDAIAAGKEGYVSLHRFVHKGQTLTLGRDHNDYKELDKTNFDKDAQSYDSTPRQKVMVRTDVDAIETFRDMRQSFTEEQMKKETDRCLGCGAAELNENMCIGCGICTTKCKFDAIHLIKVRDFKGTPYRKTLLGALGTGGKRIGTIAVRKIIRKR